VPGRRLLPDADDLHHLRPHLGQADLQLGQHPRRHALFLAQQPQQQVLGADVVVVELPGLFLGMDDDPAGPCGEPFEHLLAPLWHGVM
jgi:hypothetical protein